MFALGDAGMLSSHNTKDSFDGGGSERQRNRTRRVLCKIT